MSESVHPHPLDPEEDEIVNEDGSYADEAEREEGEHAGCGLPAPVSTQRSRGPHSLTPQCTTGVAEQVGWSAGRSLERDRPPDERDRPSDEVDRS